MRGLKITPRGERVLAYGFGVLFIAALFLVGTIESGAL